MQKDKLEKLASERSYPCVTISMNTHRTFPNNQKDVIELQKLLKEAHEHVVNEFGHQEVSSLLEKIDNLKEEIDVNYNLDSIHIFLSGRTTEIVKSSWPISKNTVSVAENFVIKPLIKDFNRLEEYLILVLSRSEVRLLQAINDSISGEIKSDDFSFAQNPYFLTDLDKSGDGKQPDNLVREFFNQIDKALMKIYNKTEMNIVVICTEKNWSRLMQVADKPSIYLGNTSINFNDTANHSLASEAWKIVVAIQEDSRAKAMQEMQEAVGRGKVITDLLEIFVAVKGGRGDLLITHDDYHQAVKMNGQYSFYLVDDLTLPGVIDDITSDIAWEVISKKGRAIFTNQEELKSLGNIALKVRY
ncbi:MAG: hypothetical protein Q8S54_04540 [Bacteroidota bacterium]|nr:hypothetical protein [Odoribacter sp.]MDP3642442.1 hypothetical protein [Bacteroidota bacterium]